MPEQAAITRARRDARQGKSPSTQAGEFVREELRNIRKGKHGSRSTKQAIAIGLSEARRAGVNLPPPRKSAASSEARRKAKRDLAKGRHGVKPSPVRSRARVKALAQGEPSRRVEVLARAASATGRAPMRARGALPSGTAGGANAAPPGSMIPFAAQQPTTKETHNR